MTYQFKCNSQSRYKQLAYEKNFLNTIKVLVAQWRIQGEDPGDPGGGGGGGVPGVVSGDRVPPPPPPDLTLV